ncbi:uncharacterized protein MYCFIDRAFT_172604 [Pseudocercospora fijiensis CIRAD86]|uniref:DUF6924 domain-containing protein n=1 Tax=Pseudocercospora fijiensis (strain CIRAD86) TaxID=383855 RepID=M3AQM1_PSEFD|nr:uncharacterized protein MYCFIDRAFT_172604 [Pseudocercospora fijiensis CIRAD86]EME86911.1 hypothetical protein MYCFIDRAFT_172604 [Pseudocercospora fijiensis CIRAD86]
MELRPPTTVSPSLGTGRSLRFHKHHKDAFDHVVVLRQLTAYSDPKRRATAPKPLQNIHRHTENMSQEQTISCCVPRERQHDRELMRCETRKDSKAARGRICILRGDAYGQTCRSYEKRRTSYSAPESSTHTRCPSPAQSSLNRFLLDVHDWEFESGARFSVVDSRNAYEVGERYQDGVEPMEPGHFTEDNLESPWSGLSIGDVEAFCIDAAKTSEREEPSLFLILDDQGITDETVILAQRHFGEDDKFMNNFDKVRIPWSGAYSMWCNLDIANMEFEEFCEGEADEEGWWEANDFAKGVGDDLSDEKRELKDEERRKLQEAGKI